MLTVKHVTFETRCIAQLITADSIDNEIPNAAVSRPNESETR